MNIISDILNFMLNHIFNFTGDWGVSIIVLTVVVKLVLMPMSIRQKISLQSQQKMSQKVEELKKQYKNNKEKLDAELQKYYGENSKSMLGCLVSFLQLPVIFALYRVIYSMPVQVGTILIPWVQSIKLPDSYFIIPLLYTVAALSSNVLNLIPALKIDMKIRVSKANIIMTTIFSLLITIKAPVALAIYFISSSIFAFIEELIFRLYYRKSVLS